MPSFFFRELQLISFTFNPLSANPTKWSNAIKQFVGNLATNCLSMFDHFVILALKGLIWDSYMSCEAQGSSL